MKTSAPGGSHAADGASCLPSLRCDLELVVEKLSASLVVHDVVDAGNGCCEGYVFIGFGARCESAGRYLDETEMEDFFASYNQYVRALATRGRELAPYEFSSPSPGMEGDLDQSTYTYRHDFDKLREWIPLLGRYSAQSLVFGDARYDHARNCFTGNLLFSFGPTVDFARRIGRKRAAVLVRAHNVLVDGLVRWEALLDRPRRGAVTAPDHVLAVSALSRRALARKAVRPGGKSGADAQSLPSEDTDRSAEWPVTMRFPLPKWRSDNGKRWDLWRWLDYAIRRYPATLVAHDVVYNPKTDAYEGLLLACFGHGVDETRRLGEEVVPWLVHGYNDYVARDFTGQAPLFEPWSPETGVYYSYGRKYKDETLLEDMFRVLHRFSVRTCACSRVVFDQRARFHSGCTLIGFGDTPGPVRYVTEEQVRPLVEACNALVEERLGPAAADIPDDADVAHAFPPLQVSQALRNVDATHRGLNSGRLPTDGGDMPERRRSRRAVTAVAGRETDVCALNAADACGIGADADPRDQTLWSELDRLVRLCPLALMAHDVRCDGTTGACEGFLLIGFGARLAPRRRFSVRAGTELLREYNRMVDDILEWSAEEPASLPDFQEEPEDTDGPDGPGEDDPVQELLAGLERFSDATLTSGDAAYSEEAKSFVGYVLMSFGDTLGPERRIDRRRGATLVGTFNTLVDMRLGRAVRLPSNPDTGSGAGGPPWRQGAKSQRSILSVSEALGKGGSGGK